MKRMFLLLMAGLALGLTPLMSYAQEALVKDTALFDKAYVPALFLTGQGKVAESKASMKLLKERWAEFKKKYYSAQPKDAAWKEDMDEVEDLIKTADEIVTEGEDLAEAHEQLEGVRMILMEARQRNKIEYYPDYLTEFHGQMEDISSIVDKKKPETLGEKDIGIIKDILPDAVTVWEAAKKAKFNPQLYGFSAEQEQKLKSLHKAEEDALVALQGALKKGDKAEIIKHAASLKPKFIPVYLLFGDFDRIKK